uniref:Uncharacterized protein n=1 Tax=Nelumbo nucifera TaxID=4432 RepID=A0A822ZK38_NELNU|nr:TPA_asm: hypothetical protein HUJ06_002025 [Nelumbo nucifera]
MSVLAAVKRAPRKKRRVSRSTHALETEQESIERRPPTRELDVVDIDNDNINLTFVDSAAMPNQFASLGAYMFLNFASEGSSEWSISNLGGMIIRDILLASCMTRDLYDRSLTMERNAMQMMAEIESLRFQLEGAWLEFQEDHRRFLDASSNLTHQLDEAMGNISSLTTKGGEQAR